MKNKFALGCLALALAAGPAFASDRGRSDGPAPKLSIGEVDARVRENGYSAVRAIELRRDGVYEVKAIDAENRRVKLNVDGNSGAFLQPSGRDRDHDRDHGRDRDHSRDRSDGQGERHRDGRHASR